MWQEFMNWLPDLRVGTFEVRDLASLIVGSLGLILAFLAIRMGREQTRIGKEQTTIAGRQEVLGIKQGQTAQRQADIAEFQQRVLEEQLGRRAVLSVSVLPLIDNGLQIWRIRLSNTGNKTAAECAWNVYVPAEHANKVFIQKWDGSHLDIGADTHKMPDGQRYRPFYGEFRKSIYPDSDATCANLLLDSVLLANPRMTFPMQLWWSIRAEDGRFPAEGYLGLTISDPSFLQ